MSAVTRARLAGSVNVWPWAWTLSVRRRGATACATIRRRAAAVVRPPTSTPPIRTPGAIVSRRPWSYAYAAATAAPARITRNPSAKDGRRLLRERRRVWRRLTGARRSWTVAFTLTGCHTRGENHANPVAPGPVLSVRRQGTART